MIHWDFHNGSGCWARAGCGKMWSVEDTASATIVIDVICTRKIVHPPEFMGGLKLGRPRATMVAKKLRCRSAAMLDLGVAILHRVTKTP